MLTGDNETEMVLSNQPRAVLPCTALLLLLPGRFAFVEFRTEELATTAMTLDKTELCGRPMNIGRPKGYVPGTTTSGKRSVCGCGCGCVCVKGHLHVR